MYRLQILRADRWSILDERDDEVFQGTLTECEYWLDGQENRAESIGPQTIGPQTKGRVGLREWFRQWWEPSAPIVPFLPPAARSASHQVPQRP